MSGSSDGMLRLADLLEEFDDRLGSRPEPEILTLTEKMGFVSQRERFNKRLAISDTSNYKVIGLYDIAFNPYLLWANAIAQNTSWKEAIISPLYPTFHVRDGYSQRFVNYLLCGGFLLSYYDNISHGSVPRKRRASVMDFLNLQIPVSVPSLVEQKRIVKLLDEVDGLRKLRIRSDSRTAALIPALFHEMFSDSKARASGWPIKRLGDLVLPAEQRDPRANPTDKFSYVDIASVDNKLKVIAESKQMLGVEAPSRARKVICEGDIIVSTVRPNLNAVAYVPSQLDNQICSTGFSVLRPSTEVITEYLFAFATSTTFIDILSSKTVGANYPAVNDSEVKAVPVPLPPLALQKKFAYQVTEIRSMQSEQTASRKRLDDLFQSMLHRAFNGEL